MLDSITPLILTYNEDPNLERTLQRLTWAKRIIIIDSHSTDRTVAIARTYPNVELKQRPFDTHAHQWNYGLEHITSEWCLSLDADYVLTDELIAELANLDPASPSHGYYIPFKYCVFGKPLRHSILPPRQALFRPAKATYIDDGHTQLLQVQGASGQLSAPIHHDDRKPLGRWLWAQDRYMVLEAQKLLDTPASQLSWGDRLRQLKLVAPFIVLAYCLILKGGIFDGWPGWYYALQRMLAEIVLSLRLIELELTPSASMPRDHRP